MPIICRFIAWTCPGIDDPAKPMMILARAKLMDAVDSITHDLVLIARFRVELDKLKASHISQPPRSDNVLALFGEVVE